MSAQSTCRDIAEGVLFAAVVVPLGIWLVFRGVAFVVDLLDPPQDTR